MTLKARIEIATHRTIPQALVTPQGLPKRLTGALVGRSRGIASRNVAWYMLPPIGPERRRMHWLKITTSSGRQ